MSDEDLQAVPPLHDFESEEEVVEEAPPEPEEAPATPAPSPFPPAMVDAAGSLSLNLEELLQSKPSEWGIRVWV